MHAAYSYMFISIFLGSLLIPFVTVSTELGDLLNRFKGKTRFITAYTETRLALGDQVFNRSILGENGWLYLTEGHSITDYQAASPLSPDQLNQIQDSLENFQRQIKNDDAEFIFVIPPDKSTMYPEHMATVLQRTGKPSRLDQVLNHLAENNSSLHILDLRPALQEVKQTYSLYFATDSHWSPYGAFFAYQEIFTTLQPSIPGLVHHPLSDYKMVTGDPAPMDMPRIIGSTSLTEIPITLVPIFERQAITTSIEVPSPSGPRRVYFSHTKDKSAPTALVFEDSFFIALRPFVAEHFSSAIYINYLGAPDISYQTWYEQFRPNIVIFEMTERNLGAIPELFNRQSK